jgi:integrase
VRPIIEIDAPELLACIRAIERRGALEVASKSLEVSGQVFRYAIATGRAHRDPSRDLRGALKSREVRHYSALAESELPQFLSKLNQYDGNIVTKLAIRFLMLTFVRTGELRGAKWSKFDVDKAAWRIPSERMKTRTEHIVPLSRQVIAVFEELRPITGHRRYVFPNEHNRLKSTSENTIVFALYRMGYRGRATASTILNEQGWNRDAIERQLAHAEKNKVRAAYHRSQYLPERRKIMQAWADYLDALRASAKVISLFKIR